MSLRYPGPHDDEWHVNVSFKGSHLPGTERVLPHVQAVVGAEDNVGVMVAELRKR